MPPGPSRVPPPARSAPQAAGAWAGEPGGAAGAEKDFAAFDRDSAIVVAPREDLLFFIMGDGDYEELTRACQRGPHPATPPRRRRPADRTRGRASQWRASCRATWTTCGCC